eukprot:TRINITY_DN6969_c0_g2_i1.p1 TRINITY_DN6969_c0_g2~~TRINITY_DN6969_c0_g2_i1.p1  ORF type:complete len:289 (-),score=122.02 TRINITY_DN6969_c0_g2_i1:77-943(-)
MSVVQHGTAELLADAMAIHAECSAPLKGSSTEQSKHDEEHHPGCSCGGCSCVLGAVLDSTADVQELCALMVAIELAELSGHRSKALRAVAHSLRAQLKEETLLRLWVWRSSMHEAEHTEDLQSLEQSMHSRLAMQDVAVLEERATHVHANKAIATRELSSAMVRLSKGDTALRVWLWRASTQEAAAVAKRRLLRRAAVKFLSQSTVRMLNGELAVCVLVWRAHMKRSLAVQHRRERANTEMAISRHTSHTRGVRWLRSSLGHAMGPHCAQVLSTWLSLIHISEPTRPY